MTLMIILAISLLANMILLVVCYSANECLEEKMQENMVLNLTIADLRRKINDLKYKND